MTLSVVSERGSLLTVLDFSSARSCGTKCGERVHFASSSLCTVAESNGRAIARLLRSGSSRISEGMATSTASSIAGNARAVVSSSVGEDTVAQVDQLAASWGLDRSNAIREILETVIAREKMQKEVLLRRLPVELPIAQRYIVRVGGTVQVFDGASYLTRRYDEGRVLDRGNWPAGYVQSLHTRVTIEGHRLWLEALPD